MCNERAINAGLIDLLIGSAGEVIVLYCPCHMMAVFSVTKAWLFYVVFVIYTKAVV